MYIGKWVGFFNCHLSGGVYQYWKKVSGLQLVTFTWRCTKISSAAKRNATFRGHFRTPTQPMHYRPPTQTLSKYSKALGSNMGGRTNKHPWNHNGFTRKTPSQESPYICIQNGSHATTPDFLYIDLALSISSLALKVQHDFQFLHRSRIVESQSKIMI